MQLHRELFRVKPSRYAPQPTFYLTILGLWLLTLLWFGPRLWELLRLANSPVSMGFLGYFIVFIGIAWLYALYNIAVIAFALLYKRHRAAYLHQEQLPLEAPAVAVLYTTCNDFLEASVLSCVHQDYPNFRVYILDDSNDPSYQQQVNLFAKRFPDRVQVVRRPNRRGFKAGNLNHALSQVAHEAFFALADADEILPNDFLRRLVPRLLANEDYGFVQANHHANPADPSPLAQAMGIGIDIHWRWYQPLRNRYGFVMLLGHGALLRRNCWQAVGGFPELVSEDLAYAISLREQGWHGLFAEDVICLESFPEDMRAFRVRHMKWTRGTCEFLYKKMGALLRSSSISWPEKLDILIPTLGLPLSLLFFLFLLDANLVLVWLFGQTQSLPVTVGPWHLNFQSWNLNRAFQGIQGADFFFITVLAVLAPILCFIIELIRQPLKLYKFISASVVVNGALGPLSFIGVAFFMITRQAVFHVTADHSTTQGRLEVHTNRWRMWRESIGRVLVGSHPDHWVIPSFEIICAGLFAIISLEMLNPALFGMAFSFGLQPLLHHLPWQNRWAQHLIHVPLGLMLGGLMLSGLLGLL